MIEEILTVAHVEDFTRQLVAEGTNVHPDDDFNNYVKMESGEPAYSAEEAALRNRLMQKSFKVCRAYGKDIYDVMQEIYLIETGLDKYIPLPSSLI